MELRASIVLAALLLWPIGLRGQETHAVQRGAPFGWPKSASSATTANKLPLDRVESFINSLRADVRGYSAAKVVDFRFAPLEKEQFLLVADCGGRVGSAVDVVAPAMHGYKFTEIESDSLLPLPMRIVDLDGDGADELITSERPAGYMGASTPPIYWYTIWRFTSGVPEDASARFPALYRTFVLPQIAYLDEVLRRLQPAEPEATLVPLAEIEYIRLKFQRVILGQKGAGLEEALSWAGSGNVNIKVLGMSSLAEMPSQAAERQLVKMLHSPPTRDLARAFLAKRARFLARTGSKAESK
jgi:hypothetical protein